VSQPDEYRLDIGDVELAVVEWRGEGAPVLLLHATGFHSRCWNQVVARLPGQRILAVDLRFHGRSGSVGDVDWKLLSDDVVLLVERLGLRDVVGVGHSIGGYLIARAAARLQGRFRHLILIDPVITSPETYAQARQIAASLQASDHPVSRRKNRWQDASEMFERFRDREPFSTWQPDVLRDYCDYALHPDSDEGYLELACDPLNEASVYLTQAYSGAILEELANIDAPVDLLRARFDGISLTDLASSPTWPELAAQIPDCTEYYLPEMNHFIPMQDPALVAAHISAALQARE
jgi:pimeloyl-ACP methyl ester carboxylesterase